MAMTELIKQTANDDMFHDFSENVIMLMFGGFILLRNDLPHFHMFKLFSLAVVIYESLMASLAVYAMILTSFNKGIVMTLAQILLVWFGLTIVRLLFCLAADDYKAARHTIKEGVFIYSEVNICGQEIKKKYVKQITFLIECYIKAVLFTCGSLSCTPIFRFLFLQEDDTMDPRVNVYLPEPVYMPFNTRTILGYIAAFVMIVLFTLTTFSSAVCHATVVLSTALQLVAQLEVLNQSLMNIEQRAYMKLKANSFSRITNISADNLFFRTDFQRCLYLCLRENILHHQAILR